MFFFALGLYVLSCSSPSSEQWSYLAKAGTEGLETVEGDFIAFPTDSLTSVFFLVRHAEKAAGENPGLTDEGRLRAHRLASVLAEAGIEVIFTTPYNRTMSTAQPLNIRYGVPVAGYEPDKQEALLDTLFAQNPGVRALIVGHSNTIPAMLNLLVGEARYRDLPEQVYDRIFIVFARKRGEAEVLELRY